MATFTKGLIFASLSIKNIHQLVSKQLQRCVPSMSINALQVTCSSFHTDSHLASIYRNTEFDDAPMKRIGRARLVSPNWLLYNDAVYKPTPIGELERPAEICHSRMNIKYSTKKMWYLAFMIRGLSIDEALKQLAFHKRKGAAHLKEVLEEAQEMAVRDHNVEFKSNLWICDSFCTKGIIIKGLRRHAKARHGIINYRYTNYFVRLREGIPPKHYYKPERDGNELMADYIRRQRERKIIYGL